MNCRIWDVHRDETVNGSMTLLSCPQQPICFSALIPYLLIFSDFIHAVLKP